MSDGSLVCNFNTNPDITGIGVRVSFYLQTFFLVFIADRRPKEASGAVLTTIFTCFGITIAGAIQAANNQLSLYQAMQITYLVQPINTATFLAIIFYSMSARRWNSAVNSAAVLQAFVSTALGLALWVKASSFGTQPECNDLLTAVFYFKAMPISTVRTVFIVFFAIGVASFGMMVISGILLGLCMACGEDDADSDSDSDSSLESGSVMSESVIRAGTRFLRFLYYLVHIVNTVSFVASLELMIKNNESSDTENQTWGFGQIFAMLVTIPSAISFVLSMLTFCSGRRQRY